MPDNSQQAGLLHHMPPAAILMACGGRAQVFLCSFPVVLLRWSFHSSTIRNVQRIRSHKGMQPCSPIECNPTPHTPHTPATVNTYDWDKDAHNRDLLKGQIECKESTCWESGAVPWIIQSLNRVLMKGRDVHFSDEVGSIGSTYRKCVELNNVVWVWSMSESLPGRNDSSSAN